MKKDILALFAVFLLLAVLVNGTRIQSVEEYYLLHLDDITPESETVTLSIRCDTALAARDDLDPALRDADVLPADGVILATGRIVGETAALLYPAGTVANIGKGKLLNLFRSGRSLAVHMYVLSTEGLYMEQAYATAVVLLVFVLALNAISTLCARRLMRRQG